MYSVLKIIWSTRFEIRCHDCRLPYSGFPIGRLPFCHLTNFREEVVISQQFLGIFLKLLVTFNVSSTVLWLTLYKYNHFRNYYVGQNLDPWEVEHFIKRFFCR